ncbi:hypothetical protein EB796_002102 [Bugula neritina]|uniref:Uncharacterized protein n=1 Tax=Bugula neritina TaxID=10212 RepID=A0A7J7KN50_BUGNE|nr:hypothetical protein EB796_002102 [Bugula neritina]
MSSISSRFNLDSNVTLQNTRSTQYNRRNKHVNDKNSNRLTHQEAPRPESKLKYDDNSPKTVKIPNGQKTPHAEHIHRGSAPSPRPTSHYVNHSPSGGRASYLAASAGDPRPPRRQRKASDSSDDDYLDVPQIIRSVPENEGRVNIRDRISQFTETQTQHTRLSGTPPSSSHVTSASNTPRSNMQRKVEAGPPPVATKPHVAQHHLQENTRGSDDFPGNSSKDWDAENCPLPLVDYDNRKQTTRMNTLEYLDQVPREQAILRGFEKAKPAARNKKGVSPQNRFHKPKHLRDEQLRPQSMFEPSLYSSDLDLSKEPEKEQLASINNRTGQIYAIDDTAYETLSRKKKIAGQRLP